MRWDLPPLFYCSKCGGKTLDLKCAPDSAKTPGMGDPAGNAYWRAKGGR